MSLCQYVSMSTDQADHLPLYAQLEQALITRIADGALSPGTRLPSEDSLVQEYAVSRTTVRLARRKPAVQKGRK